MIGIYAIRNRINGKVYIGQSTNIQKRFKQHIDALEKGIHHSWKLQKDYDEFGIGGFAFEVIELCPKEKLDEKELEWITKFDSIRNGYNVQDHSVKTGRLFKNKTRPIVTVGGRLLRIIRNFASELVEDFERWLKINKSIVKSYVLAIFGFFVFLMTIFLGFELEKLFGRDVGVFIISGIVAITVTFALYYFEVKIAKRPKVKWALYYGEQQQTPFYYADSHEEAAEQGEALLEAMKEELGEEWNRLFPHPLWQIRSMDND